MSFKPIVLWTPKPTLTSDDACTSILQYELPPPPSAICPLYKQQLNAADTNTTLSYLPPLRYFCIKALVEYPEQVNVLGPARLPYQPPSGRHDFDILQALIPTYRPFSPNHPDFDLRRVDPRLWAVLAQVYYRLPPAFLEYTLPLSDIYLPLLQAIPNTQHFSLVTVLSLSRCRELTDDTVVELRHLHTLTVLDASVTALGSFGVQRLAKSLVWSEDDDEHPPECRGPWGLRVLYLKDCINVDDKVLPWLARFPLLSVIDLRGTVCRPWNQPNLPFKPSSNASLYDPSRLSRVLDFLASATLKPSTLFSHPAPYVINVNSLKHKESPSPTYYWPPCTSRADKVGRRLNEDDDSSEESGSESESDGEEYEDEQPPGPYDMSHDQFGVRLAPRRVRLEPQPDSWMNEVADHEGEEYITQRRVAKFYAPLSAPRWDLSTQDLPRSRIETSKVAKATDRLMLFRTPPPWSALPSSPPAKPTSSPARSMPTSDFASSFASSFKPSPLKRKANECVAPADQVRKRMRAITSMQNMFSLVDKRSESHSKDTPSRGTASATMAGTRTNMNPFARDAHVEVATTSKVLAPLRPPNPLAQCPPPKPSTKSSETGSAKRSPATSETVAPPRAKQPLEEEMKPDTPRPAKKWKPISELPVPEWPMANMKRLSAHRPKLPPLSKKQTTLAVSRNAHDTVAKAERRVSAPVTTTNRLEMVVDKPKSVVKPNSKSGKGTRRPTGGGKGFDWKGWSGS